MEMSPRQRQRQRSPRRIVLDAQRVRPALSTDINGISWSQPNHRGIWIIRLDRGNSTQPAAAVSVSWCSQVSQPCACMLSSSTCNDADSIGPDRSDRVTKRIATMQLIATQTPRHTHKSELKVISRRPPGESTFQGPTHPAFDSSDFKEISRRRLGIPRSSTNCAGCSARNTRFANRVLEGTASPLTRATKACSGIPAPRSSGKPERGEGVDHSGPRPLCSARRGPTPYSHMDMAVRRTTHQVHPAVRVDPPH
jgi:hypothetical protein